MGAQKNRLKGDGSFEYPQHMFSLRNKKIKIGKKTNIFLSISLNMLCSSFLCQQHMFCIRNKKIVFNFALLSRGLGQLMH